MRNSHSQIPTAKAFLLLGWWGHIKSGEMGKLRFLILIGAELGRLAPMANSY